MPLLGVEQSLLLDGSCVAVMRNRTYRSLPIARYVRVC